MKIIIFAGGTGTRLWPLSRKNSPKQFGQIFNGKSTLQLAVERVEKDFDTENVYISTQESYVSMVKQQLPQIPSSNIVAEPEKRDVAAAIGYNFMRLQKLGYIGPVAILWADHTMINVNEFVKALKLGKKLVTKNPKQLVFIGENPRFPNHNLGWIHVGEKVYDGVHKFLEWHYRPPLEKCKKMFKDGNWFWNPGYFIVDLNTTIKLYEKFQPDMYKKLSIIRADMGTLDEVKTLKKIYPEIEAISFDDAIIKNVPAQQAVVITVNMNWADPGTLYALKESLVKDKNSNYEKGLTYAYETTDSIIINEDENKIVTTIGLDGFVIVNTKDALVVVHRDQVPKVKDVVGYFKKDGKLKQFI
ncbi:hypothetical protein A2X44_02070 [candidate division CPR3 bacterium GWF2_35_18]|uniref:Mannose-1-phosphate guanylyltransferase (GDP) n=1 Tax=candidate division CPR3 bacterium GW2011_GWF2_35_18 TaxID=1618350 RepID=A0A0G0BKK9_UNCC3|nr:MAG: Mannose-1-phosphate guanylyltransferase (GDP) [candidate division CPR3 bacterium GW2011_GWF2_35_18]OGB62786.1 MAG: hypothetical protein A2X44_02070 [candidate division CPR3 bacterium GWF2_35_18]OGB65367.1 MAG: hypothetical protein A2250_00285 [candidate division CPR3 bacterium RIFOXYA2_FULL_35_13]OGB78275.1 MAG: hypothetical protein A2296_04380 [candidate division CPR3 bacterium RIFOXYB2_FULL_35_8]